ncbi:MAG: helix-turn-helix domain-containing protein [Clostridia bacterium]|nr:helix-turn-helix domain-containing protein [Clostridia bacterium]
MEEAYGGERLIVYLIDDEVLIVESLTRLLRKHLDGRAEVVFFTDPVKLMDTFHAQPCDLLISDIRMPGMTGIEMIRTLHKAGGEFETIFLTGYDMFEYAYESIQENAFGYLLKNEADERVLELVDEAVEKILNRRVYAENLKKVRQDLDALRAEYIKQTVRDAMIWEGTEVPPGLLGDRKIYMLLGFFTDPGEREQTREIALRAMADGIGRAPSLGVDWQEQFIIRHDMIWLFSSGRGEISKEEIYRVLCEQQKLMETYISRSMLLVMDYEPSGIEGIYARYLRLKKVKMYNLLMENNGIASTGQETLPVWEEETPRRALQQIPSRLFTLLEDGQAAKIDELMEPLYTFWEGHAPDQEVLAVQLYLNFISGLLSFVRQNDMADAFPAAELDELLLIRLPLRFEEKIPLIRGVLNRLVAACAESERSRLKRISSQVKEYVAAHMSDDLAAGIIAANVGYSEAHLSRLFKESEGITLHSFIQQARMERACQMLRETNEKIYRIAQLCGYNNTAYFIRVFKSAMGITPQEFRDGRMTAGSYSPGR